MSEELTTTNQEVMIPDVSKFNGAVNDKCQLITFARFAAAKFGIKIVKGTPVRKQIVAAGIDKDKLKVLRREFNGHRSVYLTEVRPVVAALVADPSKRLTMKAWKTKAGDLSVNVAIRQEKSLTAASVTRQLQQSQNENAQLKAQLAEMSKNFALIAAKLS